MTVNEIAAELTADGDWFTRHLAMCARGYDDKGQPYPNRAPRDRLREIAARIERIIATAYDLAKVDRADIKRRAYQWVQAELGSACGVWPTSTGRYGELVGAADWEIIRRNHVTESAYRYALHEYDQVKRVRR